MASIRAWASAGPYPGRLLSPRTEKTILARDRFGDVVETRAVSDVAGDAVETTVTGRGGILRGSYLDDPLYRRGLDDPLYRRGLDDPLFRRGLDDPLYRRGLDDQLYRLGLDDPLYRRGTLLDDPLYRRSVYPLRAWDAPYLSPRRESVTKTTNGLDTVETTTADNAVTGEHEVTQKVHNNVTGEDQVIQTVSTPRGERVTTRSLSPTGRTRILFDDLLDPRRRGLREDFLLDDLRTKRYNDRLSAGLNSRSLYLDDPQWRRPKTRVDDPLLARHYIEDPLRRYATSFDPLYDPLYRHSALDYPLAGNYRLADPLYNDYLARRTAYAVDDPLHRRSAYLMTDPLYRGLR